MTQNNNHRAAAKGRTAARLLALCFVAFAAIGANADTTTAAASSSIGGGGDSFAAFHRQRQRHLLSAPDGALSQKAEDALLNEFAAMRKAEVQLQTELGGRKGNIGVNLVGAFADSDNQAVGWQLRAYAGEEDSKGANAGLFIRRIRGNALYGVNAFADYEDGNHGNFLRYSFGGEVQNTLFAFNANFYIPETESRPQGGGVLAYSRRGFDANLRINVRQWQRLKVRGDYYKFDGKEGTKTDDGFRYGMELTFPAFEGLQVGLLYDGGVQKFGGDLTYTHTIGEPPARSNNGGGGGGIFAPDKFSPMSREYSQRIATTIGEVTAEPSDAGQ